MSFLLWHRHRDRGIAASRLVLRAAEVPLLIDAQQLHDRLAQLLDEQAQQLVVARAEAHAQGHAQGLDEGRRGAGEELATKLTALAQASAQERARLRGEIAALALHVVRKLMGEIAAETQIAALAATAARDLLPAQPLILNVHPDLCDAVRERLAVVAAALETADLRFDVRGDAACTRESCRIETEYGSIDASLEAQLTRLASAWGVVAGEANR